jgi:deazaflavin-dependent oxidoreductase (nitroreductase family)
MGAYTRLVQRLGHHGWFAALGRRAMPLDRAIQRLTRGRFTVVGRHGLPPMLLTTTGRRTGRPRTVPLIYAEHGGRFVVTASNWGRPHHPVWSENLLAEPEAVVTVAGRAVRVRARLAEGEERRELWALVTRTWPAYDTYEARSGRRIRVFVLDPLP